MTAPFEVGSATSEAAAASVNVAGQERLVLNAFKEDPADGWTDDQLGIALNLPHQSVSARRRGLVLKGLVRDSGELRLNASGRFATVWVLGKETNLVIGADSPRTKRPSQNEIKAALADLRALLSAYDALVMEWVITPELKKAIAWLEMLARSPGETTTAQEPHARNGAS